ncbi:MAG TPA: alpha/beta hydrolase [Vicinamibacterales bacterium]|nr:alpha/beta hydrolase [Vicinamibacterales bacterium]
MDGTPAQAPARRARRPFRLAAVLLLVAATTVLVTTTRREAARLVTSPSGTRPIPMQLPSGVGLPYQSVHVIAEDGMKTVGWYVRGTHDALVLVQHGYKGHRGEMLGVAGALARHGYHVLITSIRGHDRSDGELVTFGVHEVKDLAAWHRLASGLAGVDPARIGLFGSSMGGSIAIQYAAAAPAIRALVSESAFSSLDDTIAFSVPHQTGLPAFPFAPLIVFWAERLAGFDASTVDAKQWITRLAPRPVLLLQGGRDEFIRPDSGQLLYDAAGEPKQLWFDPEVGHARFVHDRPEEFEERVVGFFDRYLR